ncbi:hypothetical protein BGZ61DRAFT_453845 [Ilyonectria robusta]|uniref:uncharacterized protein n=1 Tax=Ilyonectria robusta TaxID=1079257 RepID=UPI001E8C9E7E|nr:uncharacterized protein BGZ61DRAFT_453845 [Ilyonectria robusta]KAH8686900.1 hypothetical protein BGZ61DRAFT_453845 [Ilyonectria robusta]
MDEMPSSVRTSTAHHPPQGPVPFSPDLSLSLLSISRLHPICLTAFSSADRKTRVQRSPPPGVLLALPPVHIPRSELFLPTLSRRAAKWKRTLPRFRYSRTLVFLVTTRPELLHRRACPRANPTADLRHWPQHATHSWIAGSFAAVRCFSLPTSELRTVVYCTVLDSASHLSALSSHNN